MNGRKKSWVLNERSPVKQTVYVQTRGFVCLSHFIVSAVRVYDEKRKVWFFFFVKLVLIYSFPLEKPLTERTHTPDGTKKKYNYNVHNINIARGEASDPKRTEESPRSVRQLILVV